MNTPKTHKPLAALVLTGYLGLSFLAGCEWSGTGNKGWKCKSSKECKDGLRCRRYYWPSRKKNISLCAKRRARLTNKDVYGTFHIVLFYVFIIGGPIAVAVAIVIGRRKQKKEEQAKAGRPGGTGSPGGPGAAGGAPPPGGDPGGPVPPPPA